MNGKTKSERQKILQNVARQIHADPFVPAYRRREYEHEVTGWDERLRCYFWPTPATGYEETAVTINALCSEAEELVTRLEQKRSWTIAQCKRAEAWAEKVFTWGHVPQREFDHSHVRSVIENALAGYCLREAPMNSGWTKIVALATSHLEPDRSHAIWDSRVSTSIIKRIDVAMETAGRERVRAMFPGIGYVPGRGGNRVDCQRGFRSRWPSGYRRWNAQFAGSVVVREIRDILNQSPKTFGKMPLPGGKKGVWTVRGVEMVLFGDGY
jgi:hypothetical protein